MKFIDAPMGCRFQYIPDSKDDPVWIKLGIDGAGLIAESEEQMRRVSIKVLG